MPKLLTLFLNECRRTASLWWTYRLSMFSSIAVHLVIFPVLMFLFQHLAARYGSSFGSSRQLDSLLGFLTWYLCMKVMVAIPRMVEDEAMGGTLENVILAPVSLPTTVILRTVVCCLRYGLETLLLGAVLSIVLGLFVPLTAKVVAIILLTLAGTCGMGLALAGLALVYKAVGSVVGVVGNLALLFSGALVPLDGLGGLFVLLKYGFPMTWGITLLGRLATSNVLLFLSDVRGLAIHTVMMFVVGGFVFFTCLQKAKMQGLLATY